MVRKVKRGPSKRYRRLVIPKPDVLHTYLSHFEINQYLEYITRRFPHFTKIYTIGISHENRQILGIEVNWHTEKNLKYQADERRVINWRNKSAPHEVLSRCGRNMIFLEGGCHAREWISISVALNCVHQLTEKNFRNREILRKLRFFIVPLTNPDGYEYTRTKNRFWRKNRRPQKNSKFVGTDCNRNYDCHWDEGPARGSRNTFRGECPFSEPETRALRNILEKFKSDILMLLSLHSYAQSIMYPYAHSKTLPANWKELQAIATVGRNAIKSYSGRSYRTGSIATLSKSTVSGSIVDYAFSIIKIPLALVMELPANEFGFQPPQEVISPIGHESWFGIREMSRYAFELSPKIRKIEKEEKKLADFKMISDSEFDISNLNYKIINLDELKLQTGLTSLFTTNQTKTLETQSGGDAKEKPSTSYNSKSNSRPASNSQSSVTKPAIKSNIYSTPNHTLQHEQVPTNIRNAPLNIKTKPTMLIHLKPSTTKTNASNQSNSGLANTYAAAYKPIPNIKTNSKLKTLTSAPQRSTSKQTPYLKSASAGARSSTTPKPFR